MQIRKSVSRIMAGFALLASIQAGYAQINVGEDNVITGTYSSAFAGDGNTIGADYSAAGGYGSTITIGADNSFIGSGYGHSLENYFGFIGGGYGHRVYCTYGTIGGGWHNSFGSDAYGSFIGAGNSNIVTHHSATIGGGATNIAAAKYSTIPGGRQAKTTKTGQFAIANGNFATPGDAQMSVYIFRGVTTDNNWKELFLDGVSERLTIPNNASFLLEIQTIARGTTTQNQMKGNFWQDLWFIENKAGDVVGGPMIDTAGGHLYRVHAQARPDVWVDLELDNTLDALKILVNGEAGETIHFVVVVRTTELIRP